MLHLLLVRKPKTGTNSTLLPTFTRFPHALCPPYLPSFPSSLVAQCAPFQLLRTSFLFFPPPVRLAKHCRRQLSLYTPSSRVYPMLLRSLAFFLTASASALAQTDFSAAHNVTAIGGTWSSGSMNVTTGQVRVFCALFLLALSAHHSSPNRRMRSQTAEPSHSL